MESLDVDSASRSLRDDLSLFIGRNAGPYLDLYDYQAAKKRGLSWSWCWGAFFAPLAWLLYRRMTLVAAGILFVGIIIGLFFPTTSGGWLAVQATQGKAWYLIHARSKISKINARVANEEERLKLIKQAGGVSIPGAIIGVIIELVPIIAIFISLQR